MEPLQIMNNPAQIYAYQLEKINACNSLISTYPFHIPIKLYTDTH